MELVYLLASSARGSCEGCVADFSTSHLSLVRREPSFGLSSSYEGSAGSVVVAVVGRAEQPGGGSPGDLSVLTEAAS
jgi:hypothetical protein